MGTAKFAVFVDLENCGAKVDTLSNILEKVKIRGDILLCCGVAGGAWWIAELMVFCTGAVLSSLGVVGAYMIRIYDETRARPLYIVAETRGFPAGGQPFRR